ncbi:MAG: hypothetical protein WDO14_09705 [Bacteroidota bacterium]
MKEKGVYLKQLVEKLKDKVGTDMTSKGFKEMALALSDATKEKFDAGTLKKYTQYDEKDSEPRESKLNLIAKFIGYKNFRTFCESSEIDPILESILGEYYCYVRMSKEKEKLLRSPVKIWMEQGRVLYHLKGKRLNYEGEVINHDGCLFILMKSAKGRKSFYHIYRIGSMEAPQVLQGIFSGVSSDFEPIGGRAVLWRSNESFESLTPQKIEIKSMRQSRRKDDQLLAGYFKEKSLNNLSIKDPYTFGPDDL